MLTLSLTIFATPLLMSLFIYFAERAAPHEQLPPRSIDATPPRGTITLPRRACCLAASCRVAVCRF